MLDAKTENRKCCRQVKGLCCKRSSKTTAKELWANLLISVTSSWKKTENMVQKENPTGMAHHRICLIWDMAACREQVNFCQVFGRPVNLQTATMKSKQVGHTEKNNYLPLPLTGCSKQTEKQQNSELRLNIAKTQRNLKMHFWFWPLKALRISTVHHRFILEPLSISP